MSIPLNTLSPSPPPGFDNSILSTHQRCPRKAFYLYYLNRAPTGKSWPIQFGNAYHKFREILEAEYISRVKKGDLDLSDARVQKFLFETAYKAALEVEGGFENPPPEDRKSYLSKQRLRTSCEEAFQRWMNEKRSGNIDVLFPEQPFELELPNGELYKGKMDQVVDWNGSVWVRDFKTTSRMGRTYADNFDPNNQMTGYVWGAQKLSGRNVRGVIIETLYNTKNNVAVFKQFLSTRTASHIEEWIEETMREIEEARSHEEDGIFPKRTVACNDYGGCAFREACKKTNWKTREGWLVANTVESHWDPLHPEEEAEEAIAG